MKSGWTAKRLADWLNRPVPAWVLDRIVAPVVNSGLLPHRWHRRLERRAGMVGERQVWAVFHGPRTSVRWGHLLGCVPLPGDWRGEMHQ